MGFKGFEMGEGPKAVRFQVIGMSESVLLVKFGMPQGNELVPTRWSRPMAQQC